LRKTSDREKPDFIADFEPIRKWKRRTSGSLAVFRPQRFLLCWTYTPHTIFILHTTHCFCQEVYDIFFHRPLAKL